MAEYADSFGIRTVVDRCGVIAGPWQMGKVDQGVFTHWLLCHHTGRPLSYIGYGGTRQAGARPAARRRPLSTSSTDQLADPDGWHGATVNVGGGVEGSLSLLETTEICRETHRQRRRDDGRSRSRARATCRIYVSDCARLYRAHRAGARSARPRTVLEDIYDWILANEDIVLPPSV